MEKLQDISKATDTVIGFERVKNEAFTESQLTVYENETLIIKDGVNVNPTCKSNLKNGKLL